MTDKKMEEEIDKLAKLIEPIIWLVPFLGAGEVKGLKLCTCHKAKRVLDAGYPNPPKDK